MTMMEVVFEDPFSPGETASAGENVKGGERTTSYFLIK